MTTQTEPRSHALYRFFSGHELLYIGITMDPGSRWATHRDEKTWWQQVDTITVETHPTRAAALDAERAAIITEQPRHNVVHNRGSGQAPKGQTPPQVVPVLTRVQPVQVGDWVAAGMRGGQCPVGEVTAMDPTWLAIRLVSFGNGCLGEEVTAVRWADVLALSVAYREDAGVDDRGQAVMADAHLGQFQSTWQRAHGWQENPLAVAGRQVRQEMADQLRRRFT